MARKSKSTYEVTGVVLTASDRRGIQNLRVELWERSQKLDEPVAVVETNEDGEFEIVIDRDDFRQKFARGRPTFNFRIFQGEKEVTNTENQHSIRFRPNTPKHNVFIGIDRADLDLEVAWEPLIRPRLLRTHVGQNEIDYTSAIIKNPAQNFTLGGLSIAAEVRGFDELPEDRILVLPYHPNQVEGVDITSIRMFTQDNLGRLKPVWNSSINQEGRFIWAKIRPQVSIFQSVFRETVF